MWVALKMNYLNLSVFNSVLKTMVEKKLYQALTPPTIVVTIKYKNIEHRQFYPLTIRRKEVEKMRWKKIVKGFQGCHTERRRGKISWQVKRERQTEKKSEEL